MDFLLKLTHYDEYLYSVIIPKKLMCFFVQFHAPLYLCVISVGVRI